MCSHEEILRKMRKLGGNIVGLKKGVTNNDEERGAEYKVWVCQREFMKTREQKGEKKIGEILAHWS